MFRPNSNGQSQEEKIASLRKIQPIYSYGESWYPIGKDFYTSLTMVMKGGMPTPPALLEWMKKQGANADVVRDKTANRGLRIDRGTEQIDRGEKLVRKDWLNDEWEALMSYIHFREDHDVTVHATQKTVYDTREKIAGTLDKLVTIDGSTGPLDVKATNALYRESHGVQVQGYAFMLNSIGIRANIARLLRLGTRHRRGYEFREEEFDPEYWSDVIVPAKKLWGFLNNYPDGPKPEKKLPDTLALPVDAAPVANAQQTMFGHPNDNGHAKPVAR